MTFYHQQSLPEPTHQLQHATTDVQTPSENPIPWDPSECLEYLVNVIGAQERLPQRVPFKGGSTGLVERLGDRYGEDYLKSSCRVLRQFLENPTQGSTEERATWHEWREGQAAKVVCTHLHVWRSLTNEVLCVGIEMAPCHGKSESSPFME